MMRESRLFVLGVMALAFFGSWHSLSAEEFRLTVGSPIAVIAPAASATTGAAPPKKFTKTAVFVVRVDGCPEPAKARITATAEGTVNGSRRSVPLVLSPMPTPGVYAVYRAWPPEGDWVVNLVGSYQNVKAGAVIPIGPTGFLREPSKFFPRAATSAEIEAALKAHSTNGGSK